jgi:nitrogenase-stabilizing/protective protein
MRLQEELARLDRAEDLFELFELDYDSRVLAVHRLHVLKRFGAEVAEIDGRDPPLPEAERHRLYAEALQRAHDLCAEGACLRRPVFRGHQEGLVQLGPGRPGSAGT